MRKLDRQTSMAFNRANAAADKARKLANTHTALFQKYTRLDASGEAARQPLVLALHKACAGTGVDVFDLIQKLNEHNK